jgi:hypothetical protein
MYKIVRWSSELDLSEFYKQAADRGFKNNASQRVMIDCFRNEHKQASWILYHGDRAIGHVAAHSFPEMGDNSYRILARTCVLEGARSNGGLMTRDKAIGQHQNLTSQFLLPACLHWATGPVYSTSNTSDVASQRLVHQYYFPTLEKLGIVEFVRWMHYRGTEQAVWRLFPEKFFEDLNRYPRW